MVSKEILVIFFTKKYKHSQTKQHKIPFFKIFYWNMLLFLHSFTHASYIIFCKIQILQVVHQNVCILYPSLSSTGQTLKNYFNLKKYFMILEIYNSSINLSFNSI